MAAEVAEAINQMIPDERTVLLNQVATRREVGTGMRIQEDRSPGVRGFAVLPKRWVVERTFGGLSRNRRLSKDYERKVQTSETFIEVVMIRLLVARLSRRA